MATFAPRAPLRSGGGGGGGVEIRTRIRGIGRYIILPRIIDLFYLRAKSAQDNQTSRNRIKYVLFSGLHCMTLSYPLPYLSRLEAKARKKCHRAHCAHENDDRGVEGVHSFILDGILNKCLWKMSRKRPHADDSSGDEDESEKISVESSSQHRIVAQEDPEASSIC